MKKSLLALAVLGAFASAASAQSSVTLYGRVDLMLARDSGSDDKKIANGSGSRVGLRGVEDLGGGLQAIFNIEHRFNADTGAQTSGPIACNKPGGIAPDCSDDPTKARSNAAPQGRFWTARSIVGLQGNFGSVVLGREYTVPFSWSQNAFDPWGWDTVVTSAVRVNNISDLGGTTGLTGLGIAKVRNDSSVTYKFSASGFSVGGQIAEGTDTIVLRPNRPVNFAAKYEGGPIYVAVAYERTGDENTATEKLASVNGSYNFGPVKIGGWFAKGTTLNDIDRKSYAVTAVAPLGAGELRAIIGRVKSEFIPGGGEETVNTLGGLGYHYSLSKRTTVYADLVRNTGVWNLTTGSKMGYDVGLKHNF